MITGDNYEEYMIMHADGELQPHEEQALQSFLEANPQLRAEQALFQQAHLIPDNELVYEWKGSLLKPLTGRKTIAFAGWRAYAAAACIAAIIVFSVLAVSDRGTDTQGRVAKNDTNAVSPSAPHTYSDSLAPQHEAVATHNEPAPKHDLPLLPPPVQTNQHGTVAKARHNKIMKYTPGYTQEVVATATQPVYIERLGNSLMRELPVTPIAISPMQLVNVPEKSLAGNDEKKEGTWIDKLPVDDLKKNTISNIATLITNGYQQVAAVKESISNEGVSIKIKQRKLIISF